MLYIRRSDGAYASYEGQTADTIVAMLTAQGFTCTFIDEPTYTAEIAKLGQK